MMGKGTRRCIGFTLMEMVVVVGIVAVLLAIAVPALARARWGARMTACAGNLRAIGVGVRTYEEEWNEGPSARRMPEPFAFQDAWRGPPIYDALAAQIPAGSKVYRCPDDGGQVYGRCAAVSKEGRGVSYVVGGDVGWLEDYDGDAVHGAVLPPLHGGKARNALLGDGSIVRFRVVGQKVVVVGG